MQNIWTDPVWSKVIAAGIVAILGFVLRFLWHKFPLAKKKQTSIKNNLTSSDHTQALMLLDVNPAMFESQFNDPAAHQSMLNQLINEELIVLNESNIPELTKKGEKFIKKQRKLEEKLRE